MLTDRASEDAEKRAVAATNARVFDNISILYGSRVRGIWKDTRGRETALNGGYYLYLYTRNLPSVVV